MSYQIVDQTNVSLPDIGIAMLTYNHGKYIKQALESIVMQETNYSYKIILADDFSTDNTREILLDFQQKYPERIKLILQDENIGASKNNLDLHANLEGKYIAALEGDDYWTDPLKLQKQVDFLEENPDCNLCYHRVMIYDVEAKVFMDDDINSSKILQKKEIEYLAEFGNLMHTPSVLYRNNIDMKKNSSLFNYSAGDYVLWFLNAEKGTLAYLPDIMAVYRMSHSSAWAKKDYSYRVYKWLDILVALKNYTNSETVKAALKRQAWARFSSVGIKELSILKQIQFYKKILIMEPRFIKKIMKWNHR